jgi:hexosaminidase
LPGSTLAQNATAHGYRVLWSTDGVWYLDGLSTTWQTMYEQEPCIGMCAVAVTGCGLASCSLLPLLSTSVCGSWCGGGGASAGIPDNLCDTLMLGGGGEMWGETCVGVAAAVPVCGWHRVWMGVRGCGGVGGPAHCLCRVDFSDWHQTVWPRLGAISERLWSPRTVTDANAAQMRMQAFRCLLNHRAIAAAPVNNPVVIRWALDCFGPS